MLINKLINKITIYNIDDYINYVLDNQDETDNFKGFIINIIDNKIQHTLINN